MTPERAGIVQKVQSNGSKLNREVYVTGMSQPSRLPGGRQWSKFSHLKISICSNFSPRSSQKLPQAYPMTAEYISGPRSKHPTPSLAAIQQAASMRRHPFHNTSLRKTFKRSRKELRDTLRALCRKNDQGAVQERSRMTSE